MITKSIHPCGPLPLNGQATEAAVRPVSWLTRLRWILADFRLRQRHRREMAWLLRHGDDAVFKDIGISRATVVAEYDKPTLPPRSRHQTRRSA